LPTINPSVKFVLVYGPHTKKISMRPAQNFTQSLDVDVELLMEVFVKINCPLVSDVT